MKRKEAFGRKTVMTAEFAEIKAMRCRCEGRTTEVFAL
jgi:hypothetical protein